ncbi:hypothetical protein KP509_32G011000 [Ceratopteris richardii]|uniref:Uncharacterized protein n=1 Tax=Ceratopteris richardii TaxID=49495 RepID=A0A8T2QT58_CERRI|nr:hypothetical protein KP509_32G011000 [Ceratopteris richardii]
MSISFCALTYPFYVTCLLYFFQTQASIDCASSDQMP